MKWKSLKVFRNVKWSDSNWLLFKNRFKANNINHVVLLQKKKKFQALTCHKRLSLILFHWYTHSMWPFLQSNDLQTSLRTCWKTSSPSAWSYFSIFLADSASSQLSRFNSINLDSSARGLFSAVLVWSLFSRDPALWTHPNSRLDSVDCSHSLMCMLLLLDSENVDSTVPHLRQVLCVCVPNKLLNN